MFIVDPYRTALKRVFLVLANSLTYCIFFITNILYTYCSSAKTLVISYIGMQTQEVAIKPSFKVVMKSDTEMLDEVMVVAFGTAKNCAFTGSAKVVGTEKLEQSQVTNVTDALAGAVPGVTLTSNDGAPGSNSIHQDSWF